MSTSKFVSFKSYCPDTHTDRQTYRHTDTHNRRIVLQRVTNNFRAVVTGWIWVDMSTWLLLDSVPETLVQKLKSKVNSTQNAPKHKISK